MIIVGMEIANFMKIRQMKFPLKSKGLTQITGKNGAGKSTLVKFIEWMLTGPKTVEKRNLKKTVIRNGMDKAWGQIELKDPELGHFMVTRSMTRNGSHDLDVIDQKTKERVKNQQGWLNTLVTNLSFDPLVFAHMDTEEQIAELKRVSIVDLDFEAHAKADKEDTETRKELKKEIVALDTRIGELDPDALVEGLPTAKIDEKALFAKLTQAREANRKAADIDRARNDLGAEAARLGHEKTAKASEADRQQELVKNLRDQLKKAEAAATESQAALKDHTTRHAEAEKKFKAAPAGILIDDTAIIKELQKAQRDNQLIDVNAKWKTIKAEQDRKKVELNGIQDRIDTRERLRAEAMANVKLPIKGLSFDEEQVYYNGDPMPNLGEGEQIRISTLLGVHMHPRLKVMCIQHGEALDETGLEIIEKIALEHEFQIVMARVETSGTIGIVVEDGLVKKINEEAKA